MCHSFTNPIETGKNGVTLSRASKIFEIDADEECDEKVIVFFRELVSGKFDINAIQEKEITTALKQQLALRKAISAKIDSKKRNLQVDSEVESAKNKKKGLMSKLINRKRTETKYNSNEISV